MLSFPLATRPRVLTRLLEQVAAGHRRSRALAEGLGLETTVLRAYLLAAEWLGLLELGEEPTLTADGLACVYAGRRRAQVLARIIQTHPALAGIRRPGEALTADDLVRATLQIQPTLKPAAARRHARSLRLLLAPGLRAPTRSPWADINPPSRNSAAPSLPEPPPAEPEQLSLAFSSQARAPRASLDLRAGPDDNPDVYTCLLRALLDHGELDPHQLRGLLDDAGGSECGIGGYLAMATRRGDAARVGDTLVVTAGACARRDLAESPVSVALSDPELRRHLADVLAGRPPNATAARRFRPWFQRFFKSGTIEANLDRLLFGRRLESFPLAGDPGEPLPPSTDPFLAVVERRSLGVAFPSTLTALGGGLGVVNGLLRRTQQGQIAGVPTAVDRRVRVHGGLFHPGESPPRAVADRVSLRTRALRNVPAFALLAALGLLDRRGVLRLRQVGAEVFVGVGRGAPAEGVGRGRRLDAVVDALANARGWVVARSPVAPAWGIFTELAQQLGLLVSVPPFLTLDEGLFRRLGSDPEHRDLLDGLEPLAALLDSRLGRA